MNWKIAQPCHEPFEKMDKTMHGHYCHSCKKEVFDLDGIKPHEIGYKPGDDLCGRITQKRMTLGHLSKTQLFLFKWLGAAALFFIPVKKAKTQTISLTEPSDTTKQKKMMTRVKRIVGVVHNNQGRPISSMVTLKDSTGKVIDQTRSIANGKYILNIDTTIIEGDTVELTTSDSCGYTWKLDTNVVRLYPKDTMWIVGGPWENLVITGSVAPQIVFPTISVTIDLGMVTYPHPQEQGPVAVNEPLVIPWKPHSVEQDENGFYMKAEKKQEPIPAKKNEDEGHENPVAILPLPANIETGRKKRKA